MKLRNYQESILNELRRLWRSHRTHLVQAPTGAGKTIIATAIAKGLHDRGMRLLFTVPRTALINQTIKTFESYGVTKIGVAQGEHERTDPNQPIQIGTVQTLARRGYDDFDVIIVDEAHIRSVVLIEHIENCSAHIIGLTATPYATWMGHVYSNFIKQVTMEQLINKGYLSGYEFYAPTKPDLSGVKTKNYAGYGQDYDENEIAEIMQGAKIAGDIVGNWLEKGKGLPTIAFCCNVLHANFLTIEFRKVGVNAEVVVGSTPLDERERIFKGFKTGEVEIILSVDVLVEGFDSDVRCVIYAKPTKSEMRWIQSIGRALRLAEGKEKAIIFDHSGTVLALGKPHQIEYNELFSSTDQYKKAKAQREEKKEKSEKECPSCNYIKPIGQYVCEKCGFKPLFGEDGEVDESIKLESFDSKESEDKQAFYSELIGFYNIKIAEGKKWKRGWISHKFKQKFGEWPNGLKYRPLTPTVQTENYIKHLNIKSAKSRNKNEDNTSNTIKRAKYHSALRDLAE